MGGWKGVMPKKCVGRKEAKASVEPGGLVKVGQVKDELGW